MKRTRKEFSTDNRKFVVLSFSREAGDPVLNDKAVESARVEEGLRPVTQDEFGHLLSILGENPTKPIAAFGNTSRGPAENGGFSGVPYLDTNGEERVKENWTRGRTADLWDDGWEFVFALAA